MADPSHPFFIDWQIPPEQHPARGSAPHRVEPAGFAWVELAGYPEAIRGRLGGEVPGVRVVEATEPGVRAAVATTGGGEVLLG